MSARTENRISRPKDGGVSKWKRRLPLLLMSAVLLFAVYNPFPSYGATPGLDTIRVGIFIEVPGKYKLNTSVATLSSAAELQVGLREPSGVMALFQGGKGDTLRFTLDDYKPELLESTDYLTAQSLVKRLNTLGGTGFLTSVAQNGGRLYRVFEGSYGSAAEAKAAADRWRNDAQIAAGIGKSKVAISGPLHLEAGSFTSASAAASAAQSFTAAGIEANPAVKYRGGKSSYTILVGAEADAASLDALKPQAASAAKGAGMTVQATSADADYLVIRDDHTLTNSAKTAMPLYAMPAAGAKLWISAADASGVKLAERYGRTYRGSFEISGLSGKLAVINELPFEQYLYSVVGAEMPASWPAEALKAQAVAARTYALYQGFGFQVAHVVDTTVSQAYNGIGSEKPATIAAVDATKGQVMMYGGKLIETVFSANAGGVTADAKEIWGSDVPYLKSTPSPDQAAETGLHHWFRVVLPSGKNGYVREDLLEKTGDVNDVGLPVVRITGNGVKVRPLPYVKNDMPLVDQLDSGTLVTAIDETVESNKLSWIRGPFTSDELVASMKGRTKTPVAGPIRTLEVTGRGPSGRPVAIAVDGAPLDVKYPDLFRSALGGLPSTRFEIDETARFAIAGQNNQVRDRMKDNGAVVIMGGDGKPQQLSAENLYIMNGAGQVRAATKEPSYRIIGSGEGHGVGLSQYGALGLSNLGYDYQYILQYYYKDATIAKE